MKRLVLLLATSLVLSSCACEEYVEDELFETSSEEQALKSDCVLHVDQDANEGGDGLSWETAFATVEDAVAEAEKVENNICEIWTKGEADYAQDNTTLETASAIKIFDGFQGNETTRNQEEFSQPVFTLSKSGVGIKNENIGNTQKALFEGSQPVNDYNGDYKLALSTPEGTTPTAVASWTYGTDKIYTGYATKVGIGTSTPSGNFEIKAYGGSGYVSTVLENKSSGGNRWILLSNGSAVAYAPNGGFGIRGCVSGTCNTRFGITPSGQVGIGRIATSGLLEVDGRLELIDNTDADGSAGGGVIEINNALRIDANEIITNSNSTLYLQADNNGDLKVDSGTLFVDASANQVGIGDTTPSYKLDVAGDIRATGKVYSNGDLDVGSNDLWVDVSANFVGIGTKNPTSHRLAVNGTIRAKEIVVETGWSDYVFEDDYELMSLENVEEYIDENGHLPGIPSAKEIHENGVSLGQSQSDLLAKVEELTLHLIEQNKMIKAQNSRISALEAEKKCEK